MPEPRPSSSEAFVVERLRVDPHLDYTTLRELAAAAGISLQPIQYGRARKQLGLATQRDPDRDGTPAPKGRTTSTGEPMTDAPDVERDGAPVATPKPRRGGSPAFEFLVAQLRDDATLAYATLRDRAAASGHEIAPIMYGRAKALLGLVPVKPRGSKKATAAAAAAASKPLRLRQVESVGAGRFARQLDDGHNLEQLVGLVREIEAERRRLRTVLERVVAMIDEALG